MTKLRSYAAAFAGGVALFGLVSGANAATVSISSEYFYDGSNNAPVFSIIIADASTPTYVSSTTGSIGGTKRSPYETNTNGTAGTAYSILAPGGQAGPASATYDVGGVYGFKILWGSPDDYNHIQFWSGAGGTGVQYTTTGASGSDYIGTDTACYATTCPQLAWDVITFKSSLPIGSFVLIDDGTAAFEYGLAPVPLPAALPLFASGLGALGVIGWRRKRKAAAVAA